MRYVKSEYNKHVKDSIYRIYITDSFKAIGHLNKRYVDMCDEAFKKPDNRTGEDIIKNLSEKLDELGRR